MDGAYPTLLALVPRLRRFAQIMTGNSGAADDLVEVCLHRSAADLNGQALTPELQRLVYKNLYECCVDHQSSNGNLTGNGTALADRDGPVPLDLAVAFLPPPFKAALLLVVLEELSYEDVAGITEVSVERARTRIAEARRWLMSVSRNGTGSPVPPEDRNGPMDEPAIEEYAAGRDS